MTGPRTFAVVPAAGHSARMGRPKLLMRLGDTTLLALIVDAWRRSRVDRVLVVVRPDDAEVADAARQLGVDVVVPESPPPDMKASIQAGLRHIERHDAPASADAFLVAPADIPRLSSAIVDRLIDRHGNSADPRRILVPTLAGQRGPPVLFPWPLFNEVFALANNEGLNAIVDRHSATLVPCDDLIAAGEQPFADVDTPDDFDRLR